MTDPQRTTGFHSPPKRYARALALVRIASMLLFFCLACCPSVHSQQILGSANGIGNGGANRSLPEPIVKEKVDTLVLCPEAFQLALQPWVDYRTAQDFQIKVLTPARSAFEIRQQILNLAKTHNLKNIVIIGDAEDRNTANDIRVPTEFIMARDNVRFGSEIEIATDNRYADIDDDGVPDVSIGRIPADSADELTHFIQRVIRYERDGLAPHALRRINFIAGVGGFGKLIDGVIEETTKQIITDLMPGGIETSMTYGSWTSPYCPNPKRFSESTIERFNEGSLFWVYIGHGSRRSLDRIHMPDQKHEILTAKDVQQLHASEGNPIAIFLACYTCAIDAKDDSLAELMLKQEHGPIACIGGTRVTKPAAMGLLSLEMMHEYFHGDTATLGEIFLKAKKGMVNGGETFKNYRDMIEGLAKSFSPGGSFRVEKEEHVHLFHLLGDPLLKLHRPQVIEISATEKAVAGETLSIQGVSPAAGTLTIELAYRRDRLQQRFKRRRDYDSSDASFEDYQKTYDQARNLVASRLTLKVDRGPFETKLNVPEGVAGDCVIRGLLESPDVVGIGSTELLIEKPIVGSK